MPIGFHACVSAAGKLSRVRTGYQSKKGFLALTLKKPPKLKNLGHGKICSYYMALR